MIGELVRGLFPSGHAKFELWCISAVAGELSHKQLTKLEKHIRRCEGCRRFLEDTAQSNLEFMPAFWEKRKPTVSVMPPEGMRARFLERVKRDKKVLEGTIPVEEIELPLETLLPPEGRAKDLPGSEPWRLVRFLRPIALAGLLIAIMLGGYYKGLRLKPTTPPSDKIQGAAPLENQATHVDAGSSDETKEKLFRSLLADLESERALAAKQRLALEEKLADSDARLSSLRQDSANALQQSREAEREAKDLLAGAQKEDETLRKRIADADALIAAQERRTQELQNELQITRGSLHLQQERPSEDQQLGKGQLSDLVTARNLHIVDVYDADGAGHRKTSFGRVFYVEGKSLLFYAYDLQDAKRAKANVVFHVWGGRAGTKEVTHSLGILRNEDPGQGLWALTFDDSSVLAQINSVFVTAESANRSDSVPHGRKILYAYLGNPPNHP